MKITNLLFACLIFALLSACIYCPPPPETPGPVWVAGSNYGMYLPGNYTPFSDDSVGMADDSLHIVVQVAKEPVPFEQYSAELPQREIYMQPQQGIIPISRENVTVYGTQPGLLVTSHFVMPDGWDITKYKLATADDASTTAIFMIDVPTVSPRYPTLKDDLKRAILGVQKR